MRWIMPLDHEYGPGLTLESERWCIVPDGLLFERWAKVRVMAHRYACVFVSKLLCQDFNGHTGHERVTSVCVPENVERHAFNLRCFTGCIHGPELF